MCNPNVIRLGIGRLDFVSSLNFLKLESNLIFFVWVLLVLHLIYTGMPNRNLISQLHLSKICLVLLT